jgi:hypothetical protein
VPNIKSRCNQLKFGHPQEHPEKQEHPVKPNSDQTPSPPPPAIVQHPTHVERRIPSDNPDLPYGLQIVIQTDKDVSNPALEIDFDGTIGKGRFFLAGQSVMMSVQYGLTQDHKGFILSFGYPTWTPQSPIVVSIYSKEAVQVTGVRNLH